MRIMAVIMTFSLVTLPQLLTTQAMVQMFEERGSQPPPIIEEEVLKHACTLRNEPDTPVQEASVIEFLHQYEEKMLDHPLLDVPHQPPKLG